MVELIRYGGWENNLRLSNGLVEMVATLDVGPRIIRFGAIGGSNAFKEFSEDLGGCRESEWKIRGGHRFWHAPEAIPRTYVLDNFPVTWHEMSDLSVSLIPPPETENNIQREVDIRMEPNSCSVTLVHRITNIGRWPMEVSCWALSVMAEGGTAVIPLPRAVSHMEKPNPAYGMSIWSYSEMSDPRLQLGKGYLLINHKKADASHKLGISVPDAWAGYVANGSLFVKHFSWQADGNYPDGGCNFETYSEKSFLELESLSPLTLLQPGKSV
ncbi:MAG: hypothetical protein WCO84_07405, partial [bacterium]